MLVRLLSVGLLAVTLLIHSAVAGAAEETKRPEVAKYVKAYSGQEGLKIWTTRVGPLENNEMLFQFSGIDHPWDMKIVKTKIETSHDRDKYVTEVNGAPYVIFIKEGGHGTLYLPNTNKNYSAYYDEELSKSGNAEHFLTDYLNQ